MSSLGQTENHTDVSCEADEITGKHKVSNTFYLIIFFKCALTCARHFSKCFINIS